MGDVITCSARGFPVPTVHWTSTGQEGIPDGDVTEGVSNLTVSEELMGVENSWTCSAVNELNTQPVSVNIEFTVIAGMSVTLSLSLSLSLTSGY